MNILILDDDAFLLNTLVDFIENTYKSKFQIFKASNYQKGLDILKTENIDLFITDFHGCDGIKIGLEAVAKGIRTVICTGDTYCEIPKCMEVLFKPFEIRDLNKIFETTSEKGKPILRIFS